ncbi:hypothetical protein BJY52DRAFT_65636 [Lactarius psammicola]|nr:hypothetical protein BJY52DRAFT_65636 [Lactarius psammicola]
MPAVLDVKDTYGAILLGCFAAVALSGVLALQTCIYYRLYPKDRRLNKVMVAVVWTLDATHSCLICSSAWKYLIPNFGNVSYQGHVPITVALSIGVTAFVTLITQLFYVRRLLRLSNNNWFIVGPLLLLVVGRVASGLVTTVELARLQNFPAFTARFKSVFTLGLALSSVADVIITFGMCFYLQESRQGLGIMDKVVGSIIVYTVNNGALTCVSTIVSMICWLTMPHNLIFMALHFAIGKMYANSLLATLNTRQALRGRAVQFKEAAGHPLPVLLPSSFSHGIRTPPPRDGTIDFAEEGETKGRHLTCSPQLEDDELSPRGGVQLHITVEKTVQYDGGVSGPSPAALSTLGSPKHAEV